MLKQKLQELTPNIAEQLPQGAINEIAKRLNLARQSVTRMLKGESGKDENILKLLLIVQDIAKKEGQKQTQLAGAVELIVNDVAEAVAAD